MEATQLLAKSTRAAVHMLAGTQAQALLSAQFMRRDTILVCEESYSAKKQTIKMYVRSQYVPGRREEGEQENVCVLGGVAVDAAVLSDEGAETWFHQSAVNLGRGERGRRARGKERELGGRALASDRVLL